MPYDDAKWPYIFFITNASVTHSSSGFIKLSARRSLHRARDIVAGTSATICCSPKNLGATPASSSDHRPLAPGVPTSHNYEMFLEMYFRRGPAGYQQQELEDQTKSSNAKKHSGLEVLTHCQRTFVVLVARLKKQGAGCFMSMLSPFT